MFSFHSLKALPRLLELPRGSARSEVMEGVGARRRLTIELCQSWDSGGQDSSRADLLSQILGWNQSQAAVKHSCL